MFEINSISNFRRSDLTLGRGAYRNQACIHNFSLSIFPTGLAIGSRRSCRNGDARLDGGATTLEGTVELCVNNAWMTVCETNGNSRDARVVCAQLGFSRTGILFIHEL